MNVSDRAALAMLRCAIYVTSPDLRGRLGEKLDTWSDVLVPRVTGLPKREIGRQLGSSVDHLSNEIETTRQTEYPHISSEGVEATLDGILATLDGEDIMHAFKQHDVFVLLSTSTLAGVIYQLASQRRESESTDDAMRRFGKSICDLAAYAIVEWVSVLPNNRDEGAWSTLVGSSTRIVERTRKMLIEVRRTGIVASGLQRVIASQRRDITSALGRMELFGLPVDVRLRWVPIEISYLNARVQSRTTAGSHSIPMERLIRKRFEHASHVGNIGARILILGRAGSGKTTAAQWIAFSGAQQQLGTGGQSTLFPLFVRLREVMLLGTGLTDASLLYSAQLRDEVQQDWLERAARTVTPLILLDGWDEITPVEQKKVRSWLDELLTRFPRAHFVVTSRPEGIDSHAFRHHNFEEVSMLPLTSDESADLARRWFDGLIEHLPLEQRTDRSRLANAQNDLLRDLKTPSIADMADSPLLTAMLCCLYSTGYTGAPTGRGQLYDLVASALIHKRELERSGNRSDDWGEYNLAQKNELLGRIAREMMVQKSLQIRVGRTNAADGPLSIVDVLADLLPLMGRVASDAVPLAEALLSRSVVLHRVGPNEAEFLHRSFQEYFAAMSFRQTQDVDEALDQANAGGWALLPFMCHTAPAPVSDAILEWLTWFVSQTRDSSRRAITFTLVECLAAATVVDSGIRRDAESLIAEIFPPRDAEEAKSLATLGNAAIVFLGRARVSAGERALAIDALSRIGTEEAVRKLAEYATHANNEDAVALSRAWTRMDPRNYAVNVLNKLQWPVRLEVMDEKRVEDAAIVEPLDSLTLRGVDLQLASPQFISSAPRLRQLALEGCTNIGTLDWTKECASLKGLSIIECRGSVEVDALGPASLWWLRLDQVNHVISDWGEQIGRLRNLRVLHLNERYPMRPVIALSALKRLTNLTSLAMAGEVTAESLEFLPQNTGLKTLEVGWALSVDELDYVFECTELRRLSIKLVGDVGDYESMVGTLPMLRELTVAGATARFVHALHGTRRLERLTLVSSDVGDLATLTLPPTVRSLTMKNCAFGERDDWRLDHGFRSSGSGDGLARITELNCTGSQLVNLSFVAQMRGLRSLNIEDSGSLESLDGLDGVPDGCRINIVGTRVSIDDSALRRIETSGRCSVVYDPEYYPEDAQQVS